MSTYKIEFDGITVEVDGDRVMIRGLDENLGLTSAQARLLVNATSDAREVIRTNPKPYGGDTVIGTDYVGRRPK